MKSHLILKQNILALLRVQDRNRRQLAQHVLQTLDKSADSWISHIFGKAGYYSRVVPAQHLDRIAEFFGCQVHHLFQPGLVAQSYSRRSGHERRQLADRRIIGQRQDQPTTPIRKLLVTPEDEQVLEDLHALNYEQYQHARGWIHVARFGPRNTALGIPPPDAPSPATPKSTGRSPTPRGRKKKKPPTPDE